MLAHLRKVPKVDDLYVGVDSEPVRLCKVYEWLAEQLCVSLDIGYKEPVEVMWKMRGSKRICNVHIRVTGFEFNYPSYQEGYGELIAQFLESEGAE
jgi:hypothetical protein